MKVVVGISGASGQIYAQRLLGWLAEQGRAASVETHLVFSKYGRLVWDEEIGTDPKSYDFPIWNAHDMTAPFASGSSRFDACVVVPCSSGQLGRIAHGLSADLIGRTADVMLKERRKLVLVLREAPYSLVHLRNMTAVTEAGAVIMPASPSFYSKPATPEAVIDTVTARILDLVGLDNDRMQRWKGSR
jgi:flavin prenyltransferase